MYIRRVLTLDLAMDAVIISGCAVTCEYSLGPVDKYIAVCMFAIIIIAQYYIINRAISGYYL